MGLGVEKGDAPPPLTILFRVKRVTPMINKGAPRTSPSPSRSRAENSNSNASVGCSLERSWADSEVRPDVVRVVSVSPGERVILVKKEARGDAQRGHVQEGKSQAPACDKRAAAKGA